jgi:hypothetical protein
MAVLSIADRTRIWRGLMRRWSADQVVCSFLKNDLYNPSDDTGAVADVDNWRDAHSGNTSVDTVGFNGALSVAMRSALSAEQKTDLLIADAAIVRGVDYLRSVFGEVD